MVKSCYLECNETFEISKDSGYGAARVKCIYIFDINPFLIFRKRYIELDSNIFIMD